MAEENTDTPVDSSGVENAVVMLDKSEFTLRLEANQKLFDVAWDEAVEIEKGVFGSDAFEGWDSPSVSELKAKLKDAHSKIDEAMVRGIDPTWISDTRFIRMARQADKHILLAVGIEGSA